MDSSFPRLPRECFRAVACLTILNGLPGQVLAAGISNIVVSGPEVTADIELPLLITGELTITFESVTNLTPTSIGLSAEEVDPLDLTLNARLPTGTLIPVSFPVLLHIDPPPGEGLQFDGVATVEIYTTLLTYVSGTTLRLFAAANGGDFVDITDTVSGGSYRVRGTRGEFSEFIIVDDTRLLTSARTTQTVIDAKFDLLQATLAPFSAASLRPLPGLPRLWMLPSFRDSLASQVTAARAAYDNDDVAVAMTMLSTFAEQVEADSDTIIPDTWSAAGGPTNTAGILRAQTATLQFSLALLSAQGRRH